MLSGRTSLQFLTFALSERTPVCRAKDKQDSSGGGQGLRLRLRQVGSDWEQLLSVLQGGSGHTLLQELVCLAQPS